MEEEKLAFGSVSSAVKIGNTVHRQSGPWTPTIHSLLKFLNEKGFAYAPAPLGMDEQGREIISFLPGTGASRPWPQVLFTNQGLEQAARMLREYHDVVEGFSVSADAEWRIGKVAKGPGQIIRHGDLGPWNTLWQQGKLTGLVDWDFAEPGEAITDVAQMAYYFVPLRGENGWQEAGFKNAPDFYSKLDVLCAAYGKITADAVLDALEDWLQEEMRRVREFGGHGKEPWLSFLQRGDDKEIMDDLAWLEELRAR